MKTKILNYGSLNIDYVYRVPWLVKPGETLSALSMKVFAGGKGANQSIALARAGAAVWHAGKIGEDGLWLREKLEDNRVHTEHIEISQIHNGQAFIQVDNQGRNSIVIYGGANRDMELSDIDKAIECFHANDYLLLQNEINHVSKLIEKGYDAGLRVCLNPAPFTEEVLSYPLEKVSMLIVNEVEGAQLSQKEDYEEIIDILARRYPRTEVILTAGSSGAFYQASHDLLHVPAETVDAVDTTAAGDTFIGYYVTSRMQGKDPKFAAEMAVKAASLCIQKHGAMDSIPCRNEVVPKRPK